MILVTVGSTLFPFARMNALVARISTGNRKHEKIVFQYGRLAPQYYLPPIELYPYIPQDDLLAYMKEARVIICHGGPGTIYQALSFGKIPWVLPRRKRFGEHLTDHQVEFSRFMAHKGLVSLVTDDIPVPGILQGTPATNPVHPHHKRLVAYLDSLMGKIER